MGIVTRLKDWFHPDLDPPPESEGQREAGELRHKRASDLRELLEIKRRRKRLDSKIDRVSSQLNEAVLEGET